jgi:hypothetical protein
MPSYTVYFTLTVQHEIKQKVKDKFVWIQKNRADPYACAMCTFYEARVEAPAGLFHIFNHTAHSTKSLISIQTFTLCQSETT